MASASEERLKIRKMLEDGKYRISVRDNGVGLPADLNVKESRTLGLQLVVVLADQMKADLDLSVDGGTSFTLTFEEYLEAGPVLF